ncbi:hypothetical protein GCM10027605_18050 [Micromonospora zhanjiangensis]
MPVSISGSHHKRCSYYIFDVSPKRAPLPYVVGVPFVRSVGEPDPAPPGQQDQGHTDGQRQRRPGEEDTDGRAGDW